MKSALALSACAVAAVGESTRALQVSGCSDSYSYTDPVYGDSCAEWEGYTCGTESGLTADQAIELQEECPVSCNVCSDGSEGANADPCEQMEQCAETCTDEPTDCYGMELLLADGGCAHSCLDTQELLDTCLQPYYDQLMCTEEDFVLELNFDPCGQCAGTCTDAPTDCYGMELLLADGGCAHSCLDTQELLDTCLQPYYDQLMCTEEDFVLALESDPCGHCTEACTDVPTGRFTSTCCMMCTEEGTMSEPINDPSGAVMVGPSLIMALLSTLMAYYL
jgi:hypothetical protein